MSGTAGFIYFDWERWDFCGAHVEEGVEQIYANSRDDWRAQYAWARARTALVLLQVGGRYYATAFTSERRNLRPWADLPVGVLDEMCGAVRTYNPMPRRPGRQVLSRSDGPFRAVDADWTAGWWAAALGGVTTGVREAIAVSTSPDGGVDDAIRVAGEDAPSGMVVLRTARVRALVDELVDLGGRRLDRGDGSVALTDPSGNELQLERDHEG